jgi:hypothetical protein
LHEIAYYNGNILPIHLQEEILSSSDPVRSTQISKLEKVGKLKKIAASIYTSNLVDTPENIIRRNIIFILVKLFPGALLSQRSALEFKPKACNYFQIIYFTNERSLCFDNTYYVHLCPPYPCSRKRM